MSVNPWPTDETNSVLLVLDATHHVEQQHLESWLMRERQKQNYPGKVEQAILPLADSQDNIAAEKLLPALNLPEDTLVVPVRIVWLKGLDVKNTTPRFQDLLFGNPRRPGPLRAKRIIKKHPMRAKCIAGSPATLKQLRQRLKHRIGETPDSTLLAEFVAAQASLALDTAERRLRGNRYKVPRHVAHHLRSHPDFTSALNAISAQTGRSVTDLKAEAELIFKELIPVPQAFWLDIYYLLNRKIASLGYDKEIVVDSAQLHKVREISKRYPTAILCTHKTHVDFPALNKVVFDHDFPALHTLGGVNMAFTGIGFLARHAGVIFIRRSFHDDPLYKVILQQYIGYLMEKHFPLSWAFEGTRSRIGKLLPPKYGLLKYVVEAGHAQDERNLHIIPVALNYDLISDVRDYAKEQAGLKKRPESLKWFLGYMRSLSKPMGQIYMNFGEPVVLDKIPSGEDRLALAKVALQVGVEANRVTPITLASLATMLLLGSSPKALTRHELAGEIVDVVTWAEARNIKITHHFEVENERELAAMAQMLVDNGMLTRYDGGPEPLYGIAARQHTVASYYRNTTIHHFVTKAIAELALLHAATGKQAPLQMFWQEVDRLRELFKFEFFYAPKEEFHDEVRTELRRYAANWEDLLQQDADYARRLLPDFRPLVAHATLTQFVEAYYVVADVAAATPADKLLSPDDCIRQCFISGREAYLRRHISSEASIGKQLFQNGYKMIENRGLLATNASNLPDRKMQLSKDLRELMRRLQQIQTLALPDWESG